MKKLLFVLLTCLPFWSFGIEPVIIGFSSTNDIYVVPAGKILMLETISACNPYDLYRVPVEATFILKSATSTNYLAINTSNYSDSSAVHTFIRPIKIKAGTTITPGRIDNVDSVLTLFGLLVDPSDLYASIQTESKGVLCRNDQFEFNVLAASPRPAKIKLQKSLDLRSNEWADISDADIAKVKSGEFLVSLPIEEQEKLYIKTLLYSVTD